MSKVTIHDVARASGVSTQTVSRVMNKKYGASEATRKRVLAVAKELDYVPNRSARHMKTDRSHMIGVIVQDITNPFFPQIVHGAEDVAHANGYTVLLCSVVETAEREAQMIETFRERGVDGLIICSSRLSNESLADHLKKHRAAVVVNRIVPRDVAGIVCVDFQSGFHQVMDYLLALGTREIGVLAGPRSSYAGIDRLAGIHEVLDQQPDHVTVRTVYCAPYIQEGYEAACELFRKHPETDALLCYNDLVAIGAMDACRELGLRIPEDVMVVGSDDIPFSRFVNPPLTSLRVPQYDIGVSAMQMVIDRIETGDAYRELIIKPNLIIRKSTSLDAHASLGTHPEPNSASERGSAEYTTR